MNKFLDWGMDKVHHFTLCEVGMLKLCLITFGMLVGMHTPFRCKKMKVVIWFTFLFSYVVVILRLFRCNSDTDSE